MFCSLKVESKDSAGKAPILFKPRSAWEERVQTVAENWIRDMPRISTRRNVGGGKKNKWTPQEDTMLEDAVRRHGTDNWREVAELVPGRSGKQCRERWLGTKSPDNLRVEWTPQEDMTLIRKQREFGNKWVVIQQYLPGRSVVAVKNRWMWLRRRDIPNHTHEFQQAAQMHTSGIPSLVKVVDDDIFGPWLIDDELWKDVELSGRQDLFDLNSKTMNH